MTMQFAGAPEAIFENVVPNPRRGRDGVTVGTPSGTDAAQVDSEYPAQSWPESESRPAALHRAGFGTGPTCQDL